MFSYFKPVYSQQKHKTHTKNFEFLHSNDFHPFQVPNEIRKGVRVCRRRSSITFRDDTQATLFRGFSPSGINCAQEGSQNVDERFWIAVISVISGACFFSRQQFSFQTYCCCEIEVNISSRKLSGPVQSLILGYCVFSCPFRLNRENRFGNLNCSLHLITGVKTNWGKLLSERIQIGCQTRIQKSSISVAWNLDGSFVIMLLLDLSTWNFCCEAEYSAKIISSHETHWYLYIVISGMKSHPTNSDLNFLPQTPTQSWGRNYHKHGSVCEITDN